MRKNPSDSALDSAVNDVEYRNIIKAPNGEGDSPVELTCKFCGANCGPSSGFKLLFGGNSAWRGHMCSHRNDVPAEHKLSSKYILENCLTMRKLTPAEVKAVLEHKHAEFAVVRKPGPRATKPRRATKKKRASRRGLVSTSVYGEDDAEREMLEAVDDPIKHAIASIDAMEMMRLLRLRKTRTSTTWMAISTIVSSECLLAKVDVVLGAPQTL